VDITTRCGVELALLPRGAPAGFTAKVIWITASCGDRVYGMVPTKPNGPSREAIIAARRNGAETWLA
jgi:hypothetical protein